MKKALIILGILIGAGLLAWAAWSWHKNKMTHPGTPGGMSTPTSGPTADPKPNAAVKPPVPVAINDSLEAKANGVKLYDGGMNPTHTADKGDFIGTAVGLNQPPGTVKFLIAGSGGQMGYAYLTDVQVHNQ